jgi:hypothetical protein
MATILIKLPDRPESALQAQAIETEVMKAIPEAQVQVIGYQAEGAAQGPPGLPQGPEQVQLPGGPTGQLPQSGGALGGAGLPLPGLTGAPSPGMPTPGLAGGPMGPGGLLGAGGSPRPRGPVGLSAAAPQTARRRQGGQGLPGMPVRRPGAA